MLTSQLSCVGATNEGHMAPATCIVELQGLPPHLKVACHHRGVASSPHPTDHRSGKTPPPALPSIPTRRSRPGTLPLGAMKRPREDAHVWRARCFGKRIVTPDRRLAAAFDSWTTTGDWASWEPKVYFSQTIGQGCERGMRYEPQPQSRLLQLPAEVRSHILDLALEPEMVSQKSDVGGMEQGDAEWMNTSAVIFTCKQLYAEGRALAVDKHTFPYHHFPKKTRLCATGSDDCWYDFDR